MSVKYLGVVLASVLINSETARHAAAKFYTQVHVVPM